MVFYQFYLTFIMTNDIICQMKNIFNLVKDTVFSLVLAFLVLVLMVIFWKLMDYDLFAYPVFFGISYFIFRKLRLWKLHKL